MSKSFPMGGSESWKHTGESEEAWQARMEQSRKESDEEFKFRADLKNGSGFLDRTLSGKLFEKKISSVDAAHERALEKDVEVNQWLASRKEMEDRHASRRNKFEALEKEIDSLRASLRIRGVSIPRFYGCRTTESENRGEGQGTGTVGTAALNSLKQVLTSFTQAPKKTHVLCGLWGGTETGIELTLFF